MRPSYLITGLVVIILLLGLYFLWNNQGALPGLAPSPGTTPTTTNPAPTPPPTKPAPAPKSTAPGATKPGIKPTAPLTYTDAVKTYGALGYRIQFLQCHGTPGTLAIKRDVKFMMDNRDKVVHKFTFASQSVILPPQGFAIVSAREVGVYPITCDGGGAATLNVQA